jgi:hypothetical protein
MKRKTVLISGIVCMILLSASVLFALPRPDMGAHGPKGAGVPGTIEKILQDADVPLTADQRAEFRAFAPAHGERLDIMTIFTDAQLLALQKAAGPVHHRGRISAADDRASIDETGKEPGINEVPKVGLLSVNYPEAFNPKTVNEYAIADYFTYTAEEDDTAALFCSILDLSSWILSEIDAYGSAQINESLTLSVSLKEINISYKF